MIALASVLSVFLSRGMRDTRLSNPLRDETIDDASFNFGMECPTNQSLECTVSDDFKTRPTSKPMHLASRARTITMTKQLVLYFAFFVFSCPAAARPHSTFPCFALLCLTSAS